MQKLGQLTVAAHNEWYGIAESHVFLSELVLFWKTEVSFCASDKCLNEMDVFENGYASDMDTQLLLQLWYKYVDNQGAFF
jgi:hypothetical protein